MQLSDHLNALTPTPTVALNRAIAVSEVDGPAEVALLNERLNKTICG